MRQTLKNTSLANSPTDILCVKSQGFNTARGPWEFVEEDLDTGEKTIYDITGLDFELNVYDNFNEVVLTSTNLVKADTNKLYLNLTEAELSFDTGVYNYDIKIIGGQSVIKGEFKLVKNGK